MPATSLVRHICPLGVSTLTSGSTLTTGPSPCNAQALGLGRQLLAIMWRVSKGRRDCAKHQLTSCSVTGAWKNLLVSFLADLSSTTCGGTHGYEMSYHVEHAVRINQCGHHTPACCWCRKWHACPASISLSTHATQIGGGRFVLGVPAP